MAVTYDPIATTTLGSAQSSVTFSSIPSTYTDLVVVSTPTATTGSSTYLTFQFNSDTSTNYSQTYLTGDGTSATSGRDANQQAIFLYYTGVPTSNGLVVISHIQNYANTTTYKTVLSRDSYAGAYVQAYVGLWRSTAAINTLKISPALNSATYTAGSTFTLYGVKAA